MTRSRVLVYGAYPPMLTPSSAATLETVRGLVAAGADVDVVSPEPSAAHRHADLRRPQGALRLARWVAGRDEVVLRLDDPTPVTGPGRRALAARTVLGLALRRAGAVRVVVPSREDRETLVAAGFPAGGVEVEEPAPDDLGDGARPAPASAGEPWPRGPDATREAIQAEVERRAAARRSQAALDPTVARRRKDAVLALRALAPLGPAPIRSRKPGVARLKRVVRRLTGWQVDPVVEHVNRLHRAVLHALEAQNGPAPPR